MALVSLRNVLDTLHSPDGIQLIGNVLYQEKIGILGLIHLTYLSFPSNCRWPQTIKNCCSSYGVYILSTLWKQYNLQNTNPVIDM